MLPLIKEIEDIRYPKEITGDIKLLVPLMIAAMDRDGLPIESGTINIGPLDKGLDTALFFFRWVTRNNNIIECLNMVIHDIRALPTDYFLLKGSPRARYDLLIRSYFTEYYRFREIHGQFIKEAANRGFITHDDVAPFRLAFHNIFKNMIDLRNVFIHGAPNWKGQEHFDLNFIAGAWERGFGIKDVNSGELRKVSDALKGVCIPAANELRDEGNRMSCFLNELVPAYLKAFDKANF